MSQIIQFSDICKAPDDTINLEVLRASARRLQAGLIAPPDVEVVRELAEEHAAEPIKSLDDIERFAQYLLSKGKYRDYMLFIVGINFGLRVSDLRCLRFCDIINDNFTFKDRFAVLEKKTKNTRKVRKNRYITINDAVVEAVTVYLEHTPNVKLSDYMFRCESNRGKNLNQPLSKQAIDKMLKDTASAIGLGSRVSTHTLRKTFGLHQMVMSGNDPRKLLLLQKMFNHSSAAQTLDYIGITSDEIDEAYRNLNLGSKTKNYMVMSQIGETEVVTAM